jgi:hypothetical protein
MRPRFGVVLLVLLACGDDPSALRNGTGYDSAGTASGTSGGAAEAASSGASPNELCFDTINRYRASAGLPPYARWSAIESCADGEAKSDASTGSAHGAFASCGEVAQTECPGTPGGPAQAIPACLGAMIAAGPGEPHHDAILSTSYTKVACGVATVSGTTWTVQDFR